MNKKYQIFISSTYLDLVDEREQIIKACLEMGHIPVGMEMFSAADEEQWNVIKRQIDEIDYYVILIAHRYGSTTGGISYTEKEFDYATAKGVPILGFVIDDSTAWPVDRIDQEEDKKIKVKNFKEKIKGKLVNFWRDKNELYAKFSISLMKAIVNHPRNGWVKAQDDVSQDVIKELSRLSSENAELRKQLDLYTTKPSEEEKYTNIVEILEKNTRKASIWHEGNKSWRDSPLVDTNLLEIFQAIAPNLISENDSESIAGDIALRLCGNRPFRDTWPFPSNHTSLMLADFSALNLIMPSIKKHPISDTKDYWSLTDDGRALIGSLRKLRLLAGVSNAPEEPEEA
nr:DUF4062 domain-containing protein [uncultured Tolumonas sp.]